jgi:hypothetical protein
MKHKQMWFIIGSFVLFQMVTSSCDALQHDFNSLENTSFATLEYFPKSHDFGILGGNDTANTIFDIWRGGGCCSLSFWLTWDESWLDIFPTSGTSHGEHVPITITVDTAGLANGDYTGEIDISSNCGNGVFTVFLTVEEESNSTVIIEKITGGIGVSVYLKNIGNDDAYDINWRISIAGTFVFVGVESVGQVEVIEPGSSTIIRSNFVFGLGSITLSVMVNELVEEKEGFLLGPLILGMS